MAIRGTRRSSLYGPTTTGRVSGLALSAAQSGSMSMLEAATATPMITVPVCRPIRHGYATKRPMNIVTIGRH